MKTYITFGYDHKHFLNGELVTVNTIVELTHPDTIEPYEAAQSLFGRNYSRLFTMPYERPGAEIVTHTIK